MCTVKELIAYLEIMQEEAVVKCLMEEDMEMCSVIKHKPVCLINTDVIYEKRPGGKIFIQLNGED
jgi:hypothetical protein